MNTDGGRLVRFDSGKLREFLPDDFRDCVSDLRLG